MKFERIWAMGDLHGNYTPIENFWRRNKDNINFSPETDCIILLGDVGANYFLNYRDRNFKKKLGKYPFTYFCIRGNHESRVITIANHNLDWDSESFFGNLIRVEKKYPYIKYAWDTPATYNINGYKTLIIPGAYSVDKYHRLANGWSWFSDEQLTKDEMDYGHRLVFSNNYQFDLVLSHTCPIIYEPTDMFLSIVDQSTVDKTMERYLGEIEYTLNYKLWLWGHYHGFRVYPYNEGKQCIMLSAGQEAINIIDWLENPGDIQKRW